jgi:Dolichyl-phosphate-mannose-protein mannosyltransferase
VTALRFAATFPARAIELRKVVPEWVVVAAGATVALLPQLSRPGPEMDEGLVLSYAERLLHGAIPYRDFPYYGPANLWNVAAAFALFGVRQSVERGLGLVYVVATIVGIYLLVRRASLHAAVAAVVATVALAMLSLGVWAYVTRPAVAFLIWSILLATKSEDASTRQDLVRFALAGLLAGWSILCRIDFVLVVIPAAAVLASQMERPARRWFTGSLLAAQLLYLPYLVVSGGAGIHRGIREFTASAPQRHLPLPSPLHHGGLLYATGLALCVLGAAAVLLWRRSPHAVPIAAVTAASVGAIPLTLSRPDVGHVSAIAIIVYGVLPLAAVELREHFQATWLPMRALRFVTALSVIWGIGLLVPAAFLADTASMVRGSVFRGSVVRSEGRTFIMSNASDAANVQRVLDTANRVALRGQSLFVGPNDLRWADYGPTYLYFLLPQLRPASYYTVINPGVVNGPDSTLAHDLLQADWLILSTKWDKIREPHAKPGSDAPNEVVRTKFCVRFHAGTYRLYESRRLATGLGSCR